MRADHIAIRVEPQLARPEAGVGLRAGRAESAQGSFQYQSSVGTPNAQNKSQRLEEVRSGVHSIPQCRGLRTLSSSAPARAILHTPCVAPQTNAAAMIW